jgi:hypothetical protein
MTFSEKMQELMTKGIATSKEALAKAGAQAQVWGEMGALRFEIIQLRGQMEKLTAQLGAEAYAAFAERGQTSLEADSPSIKSLIARISELDGTVAAKEVRYKKLGGRDDDLDQEGQG